MQRPPPSFSPRRNYINEWQCLDTLKQKLSVYTQRLKRYKASSHRKHDNALFQRSEKAFYRNCHPNPGKDQTVPTKDQVEEFWGKQFGLDSLLQQDQVIPTNNYKRFILKNLQQSDKCRYGCQDSETIQHVTGGCQAFAPTDYKERHDIAAKIIHQELAYNFKTDRMQATVLQIYTAMCPRERQV
ncbi:unnamed protein product [Acanthoscelides obtectus]|uniref:Reverse transcriptase n=1 Tax=Acanthoscelides obtectus TaxID=200917 RepID=A0A9P0QH74_ACAOB|nr:unnamed protein product [Acanthoscelides obtectus]CAK1683533.1 hypothetical protein AOBTE_LOCUS34292 [Acanthoscelides obtectus]